MKKAIILLFLTLSNLFSHSIKEQIDEEVNLRIERLERANRHLGKIEDPKVREKYKERLKMIKSELLQESLDYSKEPMDRILELALHQIPIDRLSEIITAHEIQHRPAEFKESVEKLLNKENLQIEELNNLPYWAKYISDDYQVSVARQVIFHPSAKKLGDSFLTTPNFKAYFESDPKALKETLNKLVEQGRIDKGGKVYDWWARSFIERTPLKSIDIQSNKKQREGIVSQKKVSDEQEGKQIFFFSWWVITVLVLLLGIVFLAFKNKSK